jgi:hypothetical protein
MRIDVIVLDQQDLQHGFTRRIIGLFSQPQFGRPALLTGKYSLSCCFNKTIAEMQDPVQGRILKKADVGGVVAMREDARAWRGDLSRRLARNDFHGWLTAM